MDNGDKSQATSGAGSQHPRGVAPLAHSRDDDEWKWDEVNLGARGPAPRVTPSPAGPRLLPPTLPTPLIPSSPGLWRREQVPGDVLVPTPIGPHLSMSPLSPSVASRRAPTVQGASSLSGGSPTGQSAATTPSNASSATRFSAALRPSAPMAPASATKSACFRSTSTGSMPLKFWVGDPSLASSFCEAVPLARTLLPRVRLYVAPRPSPRRRRR